MKKARAGGKIFLESLKTAFLLREFFKRGDFTVEIKHLLTNEGEKLFCSGNMSSAYESYYPRKTLVRDSFFSLNGKWDFSCEDFSGEINVPFAPESLLSGVCRVFKSGSPMVYKKRFTLPEGFLRDRVIINFGAIDGTAAIYLNGTLLGTHAGGYDAFSFDITEHLVSENELTVEVIDDLCSHVFPYGKQSYKRGGMWYTPMSGIWQSVWLESVPKEYIKSLKIDTGSRLVTISFEGISSGAVLVHMNDGEKVFPIENGKCRVRIDSPVFWSPENPYLYHFAAVSGHDEIKSYFALRTVEIKEIDGCARILLNGKPYFFNGVLDQGYFSDGICTPASPSEYERDVLKMKELGFNTLRKHIKVEPEEFYYQCDKNGILVFQDMVNNGKYSFLRDTALPTIGIKNLREKKRTSKERDAFYEGMKKTVNQLYNHPCVVYYTIFNEGWGQFDSDRMYFLMKELDSSRIIDSTSGWFHKNESDVYSLHIYFKEIKLGKNEKNRPIILSEFGGYSYKIPEHSANLKKTYGYKKFNSQSDFENAFIALYENEVIPKIKDGLCGAIYTQVSDVEDETNGFLTYDRRECKVNAERVRAIMGKAKI